MTNSKVMISVVTWNSAADVARCLQAVFAGVQVEFNVVVVDNASTDETLKALEPFVSRLTLIRNHNNRGFAGAHNQAIKEAARQGVDYVLILNPDTVVAPDYLARLVEFLDNQSDAASVGGTLWYENEQGERVVDTAGLVLKRTRQIKERLSGVKLDRVTKEPSEVFGISGAAVIYRVAALEQVKFQEQYFDESFFAYKEDVDLAWRLCLRGYTAWHVPEALSWHRRYLNNTRSREARSLIVRRLSYKNQLLMLIKNEQWGNLWRDGWLIFAYEFAKFIYLLTREPATLSVLAVFIRQLPRALAWRRFMKKHRVLTAKQLRIWISR